MVQRIADKVVRQLAPPEQGSRIEYDDAIKGFGLRITANGAKSFILNYRVRGRERRYTIGQYPAWSAAAARKEASELKKAIDKGQDPMGERQAEREAPTVADLCERYLEDHLPRKRESSQGDDLSMLDKIVKPRLGRLKVAEVGFAEIDRLHRSLKATPYRANRVLALLSKMFALSIRWHWRADNPCHGVERNQEPQRERYLRGPERAALLVAMQEHAAKGKAEAQTVRAFRLAMLTGARIGEVLSARWDQFDETGIWTKPASTTKQKRLHRGVLNAPARQLLAELTEEQAKARANADSRVRNGSGVWLFPASSGNGPQRDYQHAWAAIRDRASVALLGEYPDDGRVRQIVADLSARLERAPAYAECAAAAKALDIELPKALTDLRVHDLRHNFASEGASAGLSLPLIGALLGHTNPATTARYAHLMDDPLRQAAERIGSRLIADEGRESA